MCPAVVFGRVVEGMAVVQRMEAMGTSSGRPKAKVVIADCGQVSSRIQAEGNDLSAMHSRGNLLGVKQLVGRADSNLQQWAGGAMRRFSQG